VSLNLIGGKQPGWTPRSGAATERAFYRRKRQLMGRSFRVLRLMLFLGFVAARWDGTLFSQVQDPLIPGLGERAATTVVVRVRNSRGTFLETAAKVRLISRAGSFDQTNFTQDTGEATFTNVAVGNYTAEVSAPGYQTAQEEILVHMAGENVRVFVNLLPEGVRGRPTEPAAPTLNAKAQKEINAALECYRRKDFQEAQRRLEKVAKSSPNHPDPYYLLGMVALQRNDKAAAKAYLEKALALYPSHTRALVAYGDLLLREQNYLGAIPFLERAVEAEPAAWRSHGILAAAYYQAKEYQKSRVHAERALEINQGQSADLRVLLAQSLLGLGDRAACRTQLQEFLKSFPNDPRAAGVKQALAALETPSAAAGDGLPKDAPTVAAAEPSTSGAAWAPPDVGSVTPAVTREVPCNLDAVLQSAARRSETLVASMQRMTAAETIEHVLLAAGGEPRLTETRDFNYLVTIRKHGAGVLSVDESRDSRSPQGNFTTGMAARGLAAMAFVFHPLYAGNYEMSCEGLGGWDRHAAWVITFRQLPDKHSNFYSYRTSQGTFEVPLRGRAWVATNTGDVLRIELELMHPIAEVQLTRNHLEIDYGPVNVQSEELPLWLPARATLYMELNRRRYRIRHTLSDVHVFSVKADQKIEKIPTPPPRP
jgi:tetratricopeptide (TPR) repeat protein